MTWWRRWRRLDALDRELDVELRDHLERQVADYVAAGMSETAARQRARLEFGGLEQIKETCRDVRGLNPVRDAVQDVRFALRSFCTNPGFTIVAVLTLALAIGANTAIFAVVNGLLFRTLPVDEPERLVFVANCTGSQAVIDELRAQRDIFDNAAGWMTTQFSVGGGEEAVWVDGLWVTDEYFDTLGISAAAGRTLSEFRGLDARFGTGDARGATGAGPPAMISHSFWQRRYAAAPDVIGRTILIHHVTFLVAGITPAGFNGVDIGRTFDVIAPFSAYADVTGHRPEGCGPLSVVARLALDRNPDSAAAALIDAQPGIRARLMPAGATPDVRERYLSRPFALAPAAGGHGDLRPRYERPLVTTMAVAAVVLLIACATIANLLLARARARRQEIAVRLALGASRWRIVRQLTIESLVLAGLGAGAGLALAGRGSELIVRALSAESVLATGRIIFGSARLFLDVSLDGRVLAFTTAVTVFTALLFGLAPAIRASRVRPAHPLKEKTPQSGVSPRGGTDGLVVAQVALSVVLVVIAGLFVRSLSSLLAVPLGFEPERMLVVDMTAPAGGQPARRMPIYERTREAVRALPGVAEATLSVSAPMTGWDLLVEVEAGRPAGSAITGDSLANIISPGWFRTLGTPLVGGRDFTERDRTGMPPVVMINEAFARQFLRGVEPLGRTISIRGMSVETSPRQIVGIAADALWSLRDPVPPILYVPLAQADQQSLEARLDEEGLTLGVRAAHGSPQLVSRRVRAAIRQIDPALTLTFRSPEEHISASLTQERIIATLSAFFGILAMLLAGVGLYGITAHGVSCRRTEIGIRLALGGTAAHIVRVVAGRVALVVAGGLVAGIAAGVGLSPLVASLLYGIGPRDWWTFTGAVVMLSSVAALAAAIPAYRASRIDLTTVLRLD